MPIPPDCPECAKVILNGGVAARVLDETCHSIYEFLEGGGTLPNPGKMVALANKLEDKAFEFQREFLDQIGFTGPYSRALKKDGE